MPAPWPVRMELGKLRGRHVGSCRREVSGRKERGMTEVRGLHARALERYGQLVQAIRDDQWNHPTPCTEWDVRVLVNHLVSENLWMPPLLEGKTIADVGDSLDGDLLGDDPKATWNRWTCCTNGTSRSRMG